MRKLLIVAAAAILTLASSAAPLTPAQSLQRLAQATAGQRLSPAQFTASDLVYTATDSCQSPAVYLFARPGHGFLVTSADDVARPLLAYGDNDAPAGALPDNLRWWLGEYAREIAWAKANPQAIGLYADRPYRAPIPPLVTTRWNQNHPYNLLCPEENGRRCVTGCVATAMAQVMKYHNWPPVGTGSKSWESRGQTLEMDYSTTHFDWSNMLDDYTSGSTARQDTAVATLMLGCGIALQMGYGADISGASTYEIPDLLRRYFRYGLSATLIARDCMPLFEWENYVYNSLAASSPCVYAGGVHAFVCDGYDADGYFHFNWGWGGMSDGYFLLTALTPKMQGIGGGTVNFTSGQNAVVYAQPDTATVEPPVLFISSSPLGGAYDTIGGALSLAGNFSNLAAAKVRAEFGVKVESLATHELATYGTGTLAEVDSARSVSSITVTLPRLEPGDYHLTPMFSASRTLDSAEWHPMLLAKGISTLIMHVAPGAVTFSTPGFQLLSADSLEAVTPAYANSDFTARFRITNNMAANACEKVQVDLLNGQGYSVAGSDDIIIDIPGNKSREVLATFHLGYLEPGEYSLAVRQSEDDFFIRQISALVPVTVTDTSANVYTLSNLSIENSKAVDCSDIHFSFDVSNHRGTFRFPVKATVWGYDTICSRTYSPLLIEDEKTERLSYSISAPMLEIGRSYHLYVQAGDRPGTTTYFTVATNAVESVGADAGWSFDGTRLTAPATLTSVAIFAADGTRRSASIALDGNEATLSTASLTPGIYLLRAATAVDARTFRLLVR